MKPEAKHLNTDKAVINRKALCISMDSLSKRAEKGDQRAQELLIESLIHLERYLITA